MLMSVRMHTQTHTQTHTIDKCIVSTYLATQCICMHTSTHATHINRHSYTYAHNYMYLPTYIQNSFYYCSPRPSYVLPCHYCFCSTRSSASVASFSLPTCLLCAVCDSVPPLLFRFRSFERQTDGERYDRRCGSPGKAF